MGLLGVANVGCQVRIATSFSCEQPMLGLVLLYVLCVGQLDTGLFCIRWMGGVLPFIISHSILCKAYEMTNENHR